MPTQTPDTKTVTTQRRAAPAPRRLGLALAVIATAELMVALDLTITPRHRLAQRQSPRLVRKNQKNYPERTRSGPAAPADPASPSRAPMQTA